MSRGLRPYNNGHNETGVGVGEWARMAAVVSSEVRDLPDEAVAQCPARGLQGSSDVRPRLRRSLQLSRFVGQGPHRAFADKPQPSTRL
jgi:hypothetical protein